MNFMDKRILIAVAVLALAGGAFAMVQGQPQKNVGLVISPAEHELGVINQSAGIIRSTFDVYNTSDATVHIEGAVGSCSCTTGHLDKEELAPGEHATLTVEFDPNYHYEGTEPFFRTVLVRSDAASNPEARISLSVVYDLGRDKLKFPADDESVE